VVAAGKASARAQRVLLDSLPAAGGEGAATPGCVAAFEVPWVFLVEQGLCHNDFALGAMVLLFEVALQPEQVVKSRQTHK